MAYVSPPKEILPFGEKAILLKWKKSDPAIGLYASLLENDNKVSHTVPAFDSLLLVLKSNLTKIESWQSKILALKIEQEKIKGRELLVPICFDLGEEEDWAFLQAHLNHSKDEIIKTLSAHTFQVYMMGFLPGFAYMGYLPQDWEVPRRNEPRLQIPRNSFGFAGRQTGIYPLPSPGGWQILGRCPVDIFRPQQKSSFLFQPGDRVRFTSIDLRAFEAIQEEQLDFSKFISHG